MQLEQILGIAEKSPLINSLTMDTITPNKIRLLIELFVESNPVVSQLVLRVFQILLRMDLPQEIFESAIQAACKSDQANKPTAVSKLLSMKCVLSFPQSKFLQLLVNTTQRIVVKTHKRDSLAQFDYWYVAMEAARTLRIFQIYPEKNCNLRKML